MSRRSAMLYFFLFAILTFPRLALVLTGIFSTWLQRAFHGHVGLPLLGFIGLPITTIVFAWERNSGPPGAAIHVVSINTLWIAAALVVDLAAIAGGIRSVRRLNFWYLCQKYIRYVAPILPRYSRTIDRFNWNARWMATVTAASGVPVFRLREDLHSFVHREFGGPGPIDYLEFGVWRGDSLRAWCGRETHPDSRFFGFDSFEGLPEDWTRDHGKGHFDTGGHLPEISDTRVRFIVGWFQKALPAFIAEYETRDHRLVAHLDADLYSSTLYCLTSLDRFIRPGDVLIFDEFSEMLDEYRALIDWQSAFMRASKIVGATEGFRQVAVLITS